MSKELTDIKYVPVRAAAILTDSYEAWTVLENCQGFNNLQLLCNFTKGSLTDALVKIELSADGVTYYQHSYDSISSGVNTIALGFIKLATTGLPVYTMPINTKYIKISAIGTGTTTGSSLSITAVLGNI